MNPTLRRALEIAGFVLLVAGIAWLIYYVFFRPGAPLVTTNRAGQITNGLTVPGNGNVNRVQQVTNTGLPVVNTSSGQPAPIADGGATLSPSLATNNASGLVMNPQSNLLQFYDRQTGQFYQLAPDGSSKSLMTDATYPNVSTIAWAPDGNQAILTFPDNSKVLYDFTTKKQTTLPKELNDFSFSPQSDKVVSKYLDASNTENQWLVVTKPDGSQSQTAEHLGANAAYVQKAWSPNNQIIATYDNVSNANQSDIVFLGANGENFPSVTVPGLGFQPAWSPDGRKLLYSIYSDVTDNNPHLYIMNGSPDTLGTGLLDLGLSTSADKCAFDSGGQNIYCAVPYYLNPGSGPQPSLSAGIPDNIYQINLRSNTAQLIARPVDSSNAQRFSATGLQVSADGRTLYFTDATTGSVQKIQLK